MRSPTCPPGKRWPLQPFADQPHLSLNFEQTWVYYIVGFTWVYHIRCKFQILRRCLELKRGSNAVMPPKIGKTRTRCCLVPNFVVYIYIHLCWVSNWVCQMFCCFAVTEEHVWTCATIWMSHLTCCADRWRLELFAPQEAGGHHQRLSGISRAGASLLTL